MISSPIYRFPDKREDSLIREPIKGPSSFVLCEHVIFQSSVIVPSDRKEVFPSIVGYHRGEDNRWVRYKVITQERLIDIEDHLRPPLSRWFPYKNEALGPS